MLHDDDALASPTGDPTSETTPPPAIRPINRKRDAVGVDESRLREEIGFYSHLLVDLGLLEFKGGNLSVRVDDDMLITKRSVAKAIPSPDDIVRTSIFHEDEGAFQASSAMEIHRAIYKATDAKAVIHAHPSKTVSLSLFLDELVPLEENGLLYLRPKVSVVAPPTLFGWNLAAEEMADCLRTEKVVVQKWHGTFAKGVDLSEAFHRTRAVEFMSAHLIRIAELREHFGEPTFPPTEMAPVIGGVPGRGLKKMD
jgi:L-fuculose-phosphate aldolase